MITTEELKKAAEFAGYTIVTNCNNKWAVNRGEGSGCWEYNPIANAEQLLELIEKVKFTLEYNRPNKCWEVYRVDTIGTFFGETLAEAVLNAVLALIGEDNGNS